MIFKLPDDYKKNNPHIIEQIISDIKNEKDFHYLFQGCVGCGKTYLAKLISKTFEDVKIKYARSVYREYLSVLDSNYTDKAVAIDKRIHCLRGDFVILDDIGSEKPRTAGSRSFMEDIIEDRYDWIMKGLGKRTVFTTNLTGSELAELYGDRVVDRLQEAFIIMKFKNYSFRKNKNIVIEG
jgi:DNA replication protein DnaC